MTMTAAQARVLRTIKSFVVRSGRMTVGQREALESLWPCYGLQIQDGLLDSAAVFGRKAPLVLEIGFGMGTSLVSMAGAEPDRDFIGVEVHPPGVGNILKELHAAGLGNLRIYQGDARDVLARCIAARSLARIQIYFPDPWHKTRHHKRRLIQADFVQQLTGKLAEGGLLHLATDWEPYAVQMMQVLTLMPGLENVFGTGNWAAEHRRPQTKFEARGKRLGHGVRDLVFRLADTGGARDEEAAGPD